MRSSDLVAALRRHGGRLAAVPAAALDTPVASCPGWSVSDLLVHAGRVHRWATTALETPPDGEPPAFGARPDPAEDLRAWYAASLGHLADRLAGTPPDTPCWTFAGPGTARFWFRRQALEVAIHRLDLDDALGEDPAPLDPPLAAIGIEEWLELEAARWFTPEPGLSGSVHLHATDGDGEWFVEVDEQGLRWRTGHLKGDAAVRGTRSDLLAVLWRRRPAGHVEVLGDAVLFDRVLAAASI